MSLQIYNQDLGIIGILAQSAPQEYTDCITFTGETSDFTLKATNKEWDGTVEYSTDHSTWTTWSGSEISSSGKKLYLRGSGNTTFYTRNGARFVLSARAGCSGNLNTLLKYSNPPTTLNAKCYAQMFSGCTNLTTAPELPATTLATYCYTSMFSNCSSFKVSSTQTGTYQYEWRIPTSGRISSTAKNWNTNMLANTGGTFKSDPSINTTYYGAWMK